MDNYVLLDEIGSGKYGITYKALNKIDKKYYAIKKTQCENIGIGKIILNEIAIQSKLSHPNILKHLEIHTIYNDNIITIYNVMEYCKIGLFEYILSNDLDISEINKLFLQILDVINYLYDEGYIHGDLSSNNILIDYNNNIKVIDFGFSIKFYRKSTLNPTLNVRPIECFGEIRDLTKIDTWALGCIYYMLLNKNILIAGTTVDDYVNNIQTIFESKTESIFKKYNLEYKEDYRLNKLEFYNINQQQIRLIKCMINLNYKMRPTIKSLLKNDYIRNIINKYNYKFYNKTDNYDSINCNIDSESRRNIHDILHLICYNNHIDSENIINTIELLQKIYNRLIHKYSVITLAIICMWISCKNVSLYDIDTSDIVKLIDTYDKQTTKRDCIYCMIDICKTVKWNTDIDNPYKFIEYIPKKYVKCYIFLNNYFLTNESGNISYILRSICSYIIVKYMYNDFSSDIMIDFIKNIIEKDIISSYDIFVSMNLIFDICSKNNKCNINHILCDCHYKNNYELYNLRTFYNINLYIIKKVILCDILNNIHIYL